MKRRSFLVALGAAAAALTLQLTPPRVARPVPRVYVGGVTMGHFREEFYRRLPEIKTLLFEYHVEGRGVPAVTWGREDW